MMTDVSSFRRMRSFRLGTTASAVSRRSSIAGSGTLMSAPHMLPMRIVNIARAVSPGCEGGDIRVDRSEARQRGFYAMGDSAWQILERERAVDVADLRLTRAVRRQRHHGSRQLGARTVGDRPDDARAIGGLSMGVAGCDGQCGYEEARCRDCS